MNCTGCGSAIPEGMAFCQTCGTKSPTAAAACSQCNAPLSPENSFCLSCGAPISEETSAEAPAPPPPPAPTPAPPPPPVASAQAPSPYTGQMPQHPQTPPMPHAGVPAAPAVQKQPKHTSGAKKIGIAIVVLGAVMFAAWTQLADKIALPFGGDQTAQAGTATATPPSSGASSSTQPSAPAASQAAPSGGRRTAPQGGSSSRTTQPSLAALKPNPTASNENEELVASYLDSQYEGRLRDDGFGRTLHRQFGSLGDESSEEIRIPLPANSEIAIIGVCDNECNDIDLVLLRSSGELVDEDTLTDDVPIIQVSTGSSIQEYVVRVGMTSCTIAPCFYSFGVYARSTSATRGSATQRSTPTQSSGGASLAGLTPNLPPSGENEELVASYLDTQYAGGLESEGFGRTLHRQFGSLDAQSREEFRIPLPANSQIAIIAVCDNECDDIDLVLFRSSGDLVVEDTLDDDVPLVQVSTGSSVEEYVVRVGMVTCTIEPCFYSFGVYAR